MSRTEAGKQIKDIDDINKKLEYSDVFRPPGLVRLRQNNFMDTTQGNTSALSSHAGSNTAGVLN